MALTEAFGPELFASKSSVQLPQVRAYYLGRREHDRTQYSEGIRDCASTTYRVDARAQGTARSTRRTTSLGGVQGEAFLFGWLILDSCRKHLPGAACLCALNPRTKAVQLSFAGNSFYLLGIPTCRIGRSSLELSDA